MHQALCTPSVTDSGTSPLHSSTWFGLEGKFFFICGNKIFKKRMEKFYSFLRNFYLPKQKFTHQS